MGCWTAFLVRLEDGSSWELDEKYGRWHLTGADDRAGLVERVLTDGRPVDGAPKTARSCQGLAVDLATRRYRFYSCALNVPRAGVSHRESMALHLAAEPGWEDWDVAYAWGGDEELCRLIVPGLPPRPAEAGEGAEAEAAAQVPAVEVNLASREYWFVDWTPDDRRITVRHDELIADLFAHATCLISVVAADATLTHWQLVNSVVPLLAHQGEALPRTLAASAPFPLAAEDAVTDGAVIDLRERRLRYWTTDPVPPGLVARVGAVWPGWQVERLAWGHLGHLAAIGEHQDRQQHQDQHQDSDGLSMTDAELREACWDEELIALRNRARDTLPTEPRRLLPPRVRVIDRH
ncbi:hypothetical protein [Streptomyces sp. NPDC048172]|uniref:hypothetical protein n=1 Tax=Streptomyces sp. NPDC048172 TaxID=3365505 RepID=UPI0037149641